MKNRIFYQGNLDGACFLYSMVNTLSVLSKSKSQKYIQDIWDERLPELPFLANYLLSSEGTRQLNDNENMLLECCERFFNYYEKGKNKKYEIKMVKITSNKEIIDYLDDDSAIIINLSRKGEHWECLFGKSQTTSENIYGICSLYENKKYEKLIKGTNLLHNKKIHIKRIRIQNIYLKRFIQIKKIK